MVEPEKRTFENAKGEKVVLSEEQYHKFIEVPWQLRKEQEAAIQQTIEQQRKEEEERKMNEARRQKEYYERQAKFRLENPEREAFIYSIHEEMENTISDPYDIQVYKEEILALLRKTWDEGTKKNE